MMLVKAASANHEQRFGRISCVKMTATFATKALRPLITTFRGFKEFGYSAGNFNIIRRDNRNGTKWCAAEFLAVGAMTGHDLIRRYFARNLDVAAIATPINLNRVSHFLIFSFPVIYSN